MRKTKKKKGKKLIFRRWITVDGKRIYPRNGGVFPIWVDEDGEE